MNLSQKIKKIYNNTINFTIDCLKKYWSLIILPIVFIITDFLIRINVNNINIVRLSDYTPNFFTISYILIATGLILLAKNKVRKIITTLFLFIPLVLFLVNTVYFNMFNTFFSFNTLAIANEGTGYIFDSLKSLDIKTILVFVTLIIISIIAIKYTPKNNGKRDVIFAIIFLLLGFTSRYYAFYYMGEGVDPLSWDAWAYKRNVYNSYTDSKKSMKISGFLEYITRDFYLSNFKKTTANKEEYANYLNDYFNPLEKNMLENDGDSYSGLFKDKNVIIVMMESIDSFLVTEEVMPNLTNLMNEGLNFTNHYSVIYGGGATFNTEFMINTGYMTPFNSQLAAYSFSENTYNESLPNLFKKAGYSVNNFHYNSSEFYNRGEMTLAFGYEKYNSALEMGYGNESYHDSLFMKDDTLSDLMLPTDHKFMTYFTTYSGHMPYQYDNYMCNSLAKENGYTEAEIKQNENLNCLHLQAGETDKFFGLLIDRLKEKGLYDNTVIIGVTDHYLYAYPDQEYIQNMKNSFDENLINNVPFFIWSSDIDSENITRVNSNLDVLPTVASLFGLEYNPSYYLGDNILSNNYQSFVFFPDYSWYNGITYYKNNETVLGEVAEDETIKTNNEKVNNILDINSKVLESNYFSKVG